MMIQLYDCENDIVFSDEYINVLEIQNKKLFMKYVNILYGKELTEELRLLESEKEVNISNCVTVYSDFFNLELNDRKVLNKLYQHIEMSIDVEIKELFNVELVKVKEVVEKIVESYDLDLIISDTISFGEIARAIDLKINYEGKSLLEILLVVLDLESELSISKVLVFINLKLYLNNEELEELYKYSKYKKINILLIDSMCYGTTLKYEKKLIIDEELVEFVLQ